MTPPSQPLGQRVRAWPGRRPGAAFLGLILLAAFGTVFALRTPTDRLALRPDPALGVRAQLPGIGAAIVEPRVVRPLEDALTGLAGLRELEARSRPGRTELRLRFVSGAARDRALPEVRRRLARAAAELPFGMEPPVVLPLDSGTVPAIVYGVAADGLSEEVTAWTRNMLADALREFPGVDSVTTAGTARREVRVQPESVRLAALGLGFGDLVHALRADDEAPPGSAEAVAARAVRLPNGEPIALAEVAEVSMTERGAREPRRTEKQAMRVTVRAVSAAAATVAERARAHLAWLRANGLVPVGIAVHALHDEARAVKAWRARAAARVGVCVAAVLTLLSLVFGFRFAGIAAVGFAVWLPLSVAALWFLGFALDVSAVAGLLLACAPFTLFMVLPAPGAVFVFTAFAAAAFWAVGVALGAPYARAFAVLAVAALLGGLIRWLIGPWLRTPEPRAVFVRTAARGGRGPSSRFAVVSVAVCGLIAVAASVHALPGVNADGGGTFSLRLRGEDPRRLALIAASLMPRLHAIARVSDVMSSATLVETWRLRLDPARMAAQGVGLAEVGRAFAVAGEGVIVGEVVSAGTRLPVRLRLAPGAAGESFERLLLRGAHKNTPALYLSDVGAAERTRQPRARLRVNGTPAVEIRGRWRRREARAALARLCRGIEIPEGYACDCRIVDAPI